MPRERHSQQCKMAPTVRQSSMQINTREQSAWLNLSVDLVGRNLQSEIDQGGPLIPVKVSLTRRSRSRGAGQIDHPV